MAVAVAGMWQCAAVCCSVLQRVALCCSVLQYIEALSDVSSSWCLSVEVIYL